VVPFRGFDFDAVTVTAWVRFSGPSNKTLLSFATPGSPSSFTIAFDGTPSAVITIGGFTWISSELTPLMDSQWYVGLPGRECCDWVATLMAARRC
jgi:hypothetical protein